MRGRIEERVIDMVWRFGVARNTILSSFNPLVIKKVKKIDPEMRTGFIYEKRLPNFNQKLAKGLIVNSWHPQFKGVNALVVERAEKAGSTIFPWTVNDPEALLRMKELGVDGVITDFPKLAKRIFQHERVVVNL